MSAMIRKYVSDFDIWYVQVMAGKFPVEFSYDHDPSDVEIQQSVDNLTPIAVIILEADNGQTN